jgi:hypothetical protein
MRQVEERAATMVVSELGALRWEGRACPAHLGAPTTSTSSLQGHVEPLEVTTNLDEQVMATLKRTGGVMTDCREHAAVVVRLRRRDMDRRHSQEAGV